MKSNAGGISKYNDRVDPLEAEFVGLSMDLSVRVKEIMERKGLSQKDVAAAMGKHESEVSRWLSGIHNITLRNIARLNLALEEKLFYVPTVSTLADVPYVGHADIASATLSFELEGPVRSGVHVPVLNPADILAQILRDAPNDINWALAA